MFKPYLSYLQYLLPQHLLSKLAGKLANIQQPAVKNFLINHFIKTYHVDMSESLIKNPEDFSSFNQFFIRELTPGCRPIANGTNEIASPADGCIAQMGNINKNLLLQAKNFYFNLETLLGNQKELIDSFYNGVFATLYLAPHNYHRVHMPLEGQLEKTIYIPGNLFSVNRMTCELIPNIFSRNERLICVFKTSAGPMAVILIGAMIVGSIQTVWMQQPIRANRILIENFSDGIKLTKGAELGYFKLGSTVILLFGKDQITWQALPINTSIRMGQCLGTQNPSDKKILN